MWKSRKMLIKKLRKIDPSASEVELSTVSIQTLERRVAVQESWREAVKMWTKTKKNLRG